MTTPFWDEYASTAELLEQDGWTQVTKTTGGEISVGDELFVRVFRGATATQMEELPQLARVERIAGGSLIDDGDYALAHTVHAEATPELIELFHRPFGWSQVSERDGPTSIWTRCDIPLVPNRRAQVWVRTPTAAWGRTFAALEQDGWTQVTETTSREVRLGDDLFVRVFRSRDPWTRENEYPQLSGVERRSEGSCVGSYFHYADFMLDRAVYVEATPELIDVFRQPWNEAHAMSDPTLFSICTRCDIPLAEGARAQVWFRSPCILK